MALVHSPSIVTSGLVLCLDAANRKSYPSPFTGTTWTDLSGNGNNGTLENGVVYSSENGGSLVFDTSDEYVRVPSSQVTPGKNAFTWNFWCKLNDLTNFSILLSGEGSNNTDWGVIFLDPRSGGGLGYYAGSTLIDDNNPSFGSNWWYVSFVGSGGADGSRNLKLYRNAVQAGNTGTPNGSSYNFKGGSPTRIIGANHSSYSEIMRGNISNVSYYNRALTATEIQQNFNATKSRYGL